MGQTLTGLGKWWGRKPLVLCRATILGPLLPATNNPQKDREVFLRLMTMDDDGMLRRKSANIPAKELFKRLQPSERTMYFEKTANVLPSPGGDCRGVGEPKVKHGLSKEEKQELQRRVFLSLSYDERLEYCDRPDQIDGPSPESWAVVNEWLVKVFGPPPSNHVAADVRRLTSSIPRPKPLAHGSLSLLTSAATKPEEAFGGYGITSLQELVRFLGEKRFGHVPRVGDSFSGGGSIPFEAARIGCDAYASDLNPVAAMLTWASLNIVGKGEGVTQSVQKAQREVYDAVDRRIVEWGIEHREPDSKTGRRWRADAYLYCIEATCPECGWRVPLAPTWVLGYGTRTIARLVPNACANRFNFEIESNVSADKLAAEEYIPLLANSKANQTRLKTATEFGRKDMIGNAASQTGFGASLVRHALFAAFKTAETESPRDGITWLKTEVKDYASSRQRVIEILEFLAARRQNASLPHWHKDADAAALLAGALRNRQDNV